MSGSTVGEFADFCTAAFTAVGVPTPDAHVTARALVASEAWGLASHGLLRVPQYLRRLQAGGINPGGAGREGADLGALVVIDGEAGLGQVHLDRAARLGVARAQRHGISAVAVSNSHHAGALTVSAWPALRAGCAVICVSNGPAVMPTPRGDRPLLSTSPICIAMAAEPGGAPVIVDMSTSAVARGTIAGHAARGERLPDGWAYDAAGHPTTDPQAALRGMLASLGGTKGAALAVGVEALTGVMIGPLLSAEVPDLFDPAADARPQGIGHLIITLNVAALDGSDEMTHADRTPQQRLAQLRSLAQSAGSRLPGAGKTDPDALDPSATLTVPPGVRAALTEWAERLGLDGVP